MKGIAKKTAGRADSVRIPDGLTLGKSLRQAGRRPLNQLDLHQFRYILPELRKTPIWIFADIFIGLIDETIHHQEYLHAKLSGDHVFADIVADHQAFMRIQSGLTKDFSIIIEVGLAPADVLIGSVEFEFIGGKAGPADARLSRDGREQRVRREGNAKALFLDPSNCFGCFLIESAEHTGVLKFVRIEFIEQRLIHERCFYHLCKKSRQGAQDSF